MDRLTCKMLRGVLLGLAVAALGACSVQTTGDTAVIEITNPFAGEGLTPDLLRVIYVVAGLLLLVIGYRVFDIAIAVAGAVVGAGFALSLLGGQGSDLVSLIVLIVGGIIGAILARFLQYIAVFLIGAYIGANVALSVWAIFSPEPLGLVLVALFAVLGGLILLGLYFQLTVVVTAAVGAVLLTQAFGLNTIWLVALFVVGALVQFALARRAGVALRRSR